MSPSSIKNGESIIPQTERLKNTEIDSGEMKSLATGLVDEVKAHFPGNFDIKVRTRSEKKRLFSFEYDLENSADNNDERSITIFVPSEGNRLVIGAKDGQKDFLSSFSGMFLRSLRRANNPEIGSKSKVSDDFREAARLTNDMFSELLSKGIDGKKIDNDDEDYIKTVLAVASFIGAGTTETSDMLMSVSSKWGEYLRSYKPSKRELEDQP